MAFFEPFGQHNFCGSFVSDAAALAWIQAQRWDTLKNGTGDPEEGVHYWDSVLLTEKVWNGTAWAVLTVGVPSLAAVLATGGNSAGASTINMNANKITAVASATVAGDALAYGQSGAALSGLALMSQRLTGLAAPSAATDAATKGYVDTLIQGLSWQTEVISFLNTPPGGPGDGDRYIVDAAPTGAWVGHADDIAEWDATAGAWIFITARESLACYVLGLNTFYMYNGASWVVLSSLFGYTLQMAYQASAGPASVTVNNGDVSWNLTGAYSYNIDVTGVTGGADGWQVLAGTDYLSALYTGANSLAYAAQVTNYDVDASGTISFNGLSIDTSSHLTGDGTLEIYGGSAASNSLRLGSTAHATKGLIYLGTASAYDEVNDRLGVRTTSPGAVIEAALSTGVIGVKGTSDSVEGVYGVSTSSSGVRGSSSSSYGGRFSSSSGWACYGVSTTSIGGYFRSTTNSALYAIQTGTLTANNASGAVNITRDVDGASSYSATGNIISITDNPTNCTSISGYLFKAVIGSTERVRFDPRVVDGASAVGYFFDTANALSTAGAKLASWRNNGVEKAYIGYDGLISAPTVACSNLTDGYVPYHVSDASGLANSGLYYSSAGFGFGTTSFGAAAANVLSIGQGTAPGSAIDIVGVWAADNNGAAGNTGLHIKSETGYTHSFYSSYSLKSTDYVYTTTGSQVIIGLGASTGNTYTQIAAYSSGGSALNALKLRASGVLVTNDASVTTASAQLHSYATTEQLRLGYNATHYVPFTVGSTGILTIAPNNDGAASYVSITGCLGVGTASPGAVIEAALSTGVTGIKGTSDTANGGYFTSSSKAGIVGSSTSGAGVYGVSTSYYGGWFASDTSRGAYITTRLGICTYIHKTGTLTASESANVLYVLRDVDGASSWAVSGNIIAITDNPTNCTSISGYLLTATIGATERVRWNPRVADGASAVAYFFDTANDLATAGSIIASFRTNNVERFSVRGNGNFGNLIGAYGTSATNTIGIASGTAPSTSPADAVQLYSADLAGTAGLASLQVRTESGAIAAFGRNWLLGGSTTMDGSAVGVLQITNGTPPAAHVDNAIQIFSADTDGLYGTGVASLALYTEEPILSDGPYVCDRALPVTINGENFLLGLVLNEAT